MNIMRFLFTLSIELSAKKNEIGIIEEIETSPEPIVAENRLDTKTYTPMFLSGTNISGVDIEENMKEEVTTNSIQTLEPKKDFEFTIPFITKSNELKEEDINQVATYILDQSEKNFEK
jgi:hypothetical protein